MFVRLRTSFNTKYYQKTCPAWNSMSPSRTGYPGPLYLLCQAEAMRTCDLTKAPRSAPPSLGAFCTQSPTRYKDGSPQRGLVDLHVSSAFPANCNSWMGLPGVGRAQISQSFGVYFGGSSHSGSRERNSREHQSESNRG